MKILPCSVVLGLAAVLVSGGMASGAPSEDASSPAPVSLQLATFSCDVTPPEGHPLCGGWIKALVGVDDPQLAKGILLRDSGGTYVLCVIDWCELRNEAYDLFRARLAEAAGTTPERVAVHTIHAHNAPLTDLGAQRILDGAKGAPVHADIAFLEGAAERSAAAAREAAGRLRSVTHVAAGSAPVERVASNRRLLQPDGSIRVRYSSAADPKLREAPEGLIDPVLRTVAFADGDDLVACLHYYATHPQSHYGDGRATPDFPGIARERLEKETGVFQLHFTGCAGNVAAGKYNDGTPPRREELAARMLDAMKRSLATLRRRPAGPISWKVRPVELPLRKEPSESAEAQRKILGDPDAPAVKRIGAALALSTIERARAARPIELTSLGIADVRLLHLPGEPFVEFQLEAASLRPDLFVAVAGYGDCAHGYICTEASYAEGGYEPTASLLDPVSEGYFRGAIADLLADSPIPSARLLGVRRIWDAGKHNAFTDLVRHRGRWLCTFREGDGHVSPEASIRVIRCADGEAWESAALISVSGIDLRDPKLATAPDGRLMLTGGWRTWPKEGPASLRSWVSFSESEDGGAWTEPRLVLEEGDWLWRVLWLDGSEPMAIGVAYGKPAPGTWISRLVAGADGIAYETVADLTASTAAIVSTAASGLTEATLRAGEGGLLHCLHRRDGGTRTALLGTSRPPFREWTWKDAGFYFGGPDAIRHGGRWLAAGRWMVGAPKTVVARADWERGTLEPILELPSGGDTSYPGLVSHEGDLWMSYYSSHEGKAAIYLARIAVE